MKLKLSSQKLILIFSLLFLQANAVNAKTWALFSQEKSDLEKAAPLLQMIHHIAQAKESVWLTAYSWSLKDLDHALLQARARGADVYVLLNKAVATSSSMKSRLEALAAEGVHFKVSPISMHEKMALIDHHLFINTSSNFSNGALKNYDEAFIFHDLSQISSRNHSDIFITKKLIHQAIKEMHLLWSAGRHFLIPFASENSFQILSSRSSSPSPSVLLERHKKTMTFFSSSQNMDFLPLEEPLQGALFKIHSTERQVIVQQIISDIRRAEKTIDLCLNHFYLSSVREELTRAVKRGVRVRLFADNQEFSLSTRGGEQTPYFIKDLQELGLKAEKMNQHIRFKFYSFDPQPQWWLLNHHKFFIDAANPSKAILYAGSHNLSLNAENKQFDNFIRYTKTPELIKSFQQEFKRLWHLNRPENGDLPQKIKNELSILLGEEKGTVTLHHTKEAWSLGAEEMTTLYRSFYKHLGSDYQARNIARCAKWNSDLREFEGCPAAL
jgi:phosphatidylserine/phosphatidylglycerophosphate/cardiolipin synthase-like enzyme